MILARSESCLPFNGPCRFKDVIVPSDNTPLIGIFWIRKPKSGFLVRERNNVTRNTTIATITMNAIIPIIIFKFQNRFLIS